MNIGEAAKASGVSAKAIRYYETAGLIERADRSDGNYRLYTEADIRVLRFIHRARDLGFSIDRIRRLLDLWQNKDRASADVKRLALEHVREIEAKIEALITMRDAVEGSRPPAKAITVPIARSLRISSTAASATC